LFFLNLDIYTQALITLILLKHALGSPT